MSRQRSFDSKRAKGHTRKQAAVDGSERVDDEMASNAQTLPAAGDEQWITRREAVAIAGVHYNTIRQWERKGHFKVKRELRGAVEESLISAAELRSFLKERGLRQHEMVLAPSALSENPEALEIWRRYEVSQAEVVALREEVAALRASLEAEKERATADREERLALTKEFLAVARGERKG